MRGVMWKVNIYHRELLATLLGPLIVPAILLLVFGGTNKAVFYVSAMFSYGIMFIFIIPAIAMLSSFKKLTIYSLAFWGAISGSIALLVMAQFLDSFLGGGIVPQISSAVEFIVIGLVGAFFGLLIAISWGLIANLKIDSTST